MASLCITNSFFECTKETPQALHAEAMYLHSITSVTIHNNVFSKCCVDSIGGAVLISRCCSAENKETLIDNCKFLSCKGTSDCGGGLYAEHNEYDNFLINTLFSRFSNMRRGGIYFYYLSSVDLNE